MTPTWTTIFANICEGRPLLGSLLEGGHLIRILTLGRAGGGQLKHLTKTPSPKGKGTLNLFYCCPTDDKGGPCHAPDCDGRSACMLQLEHTQKTKDGQEVKNQDHFCCPITCGFCGKRRHYEDECCIKRCKSKKPPKAEEEWRNTVSKSGGAEGGGPNRGGSKGKGDPGGRRSSAPPPLVEEEHPTPHLGVSRPVKNGQPLPPPALVAPTRAAKTPKSSA